MSSTGKIKYLIVGTLKKPLPSQRIELYKLLVESERTDYLNRRLDEENVPREVLATIGKDGNHESVNMDAIGRLISLAYRYDIPTEEIVNQLENLSCCPVWSKGKLIKSPADGIAKILKEKILGVTTTLSLPELDIDVTKVYTNGHNPPLCPDCQAPLVIAEGCQSCKECGYSRCG